MGGAPGVGDNIEKNLHRRHPDLHVAGTYCPPHGFDQDEGETARIIADINEAHVDILFIGVGTPKQEKWAHAHLALLNVGPIMCVGGAFDFAAGTKTRAPLLLQRAGLEWLWRLVHEPRRLWKRYLVRDAKFIGLAFHESLKLSKHRKHRG